MLFLRIHVFTQRGGGGITGTPGPPLATPPEFKKVASEDVKFVLSSFAHSSANSECERLLSVVDSSQRCPWSVKWYLCYSYCAYVFCCCSFSSFFYQYSVQKTSIIQISENVSQIRSTVAGYEALSGGFKPIRNGELFKMNINRLYRIILLYTVTLPQ